MPTRRRGATGTGMVAGGARTALLRVRVGAPFVVRRIASFNAVGANALVRARFWVTPSPQAGSLPPPGTPVLGLQGGDDFLVANGQWTTVETHIPAAESDVGVLVEAENTDVNPHVTVVVVEWDELDVSFGQVGGGEVGATGGG